MLTYDEESWELPPRKMLVKGARAALPVIAADYSRGYRGKIYYHKRRDGTKAPVEVAMTKDLGHGSCGGYSWMLDQVTLPAMRILADEVKRQEKELKRCTPSKT